MKKSVKINGDEWTLRSLTYGEKMDCEILSERDSGGLLEYGFIRQMQYRMACKTKPSDANYNVELELCKKKIDNLDLKNGKLLRDVCLDLMNAKGDVSKK